MGDHHFMQHCIKHTFSLSDIHLLDSFPGPNPYLQSPIEFSGFPQLPDFPDHNFATATTPIAAPDISNDSSRKRKAPDPPEIIPPNTSAHSSPDKNSNNRIRKTRKRSGNGKKAKTDEDEKQREVVHVRARRGQATDRHSLAERVRRTKIKERLRCLQDIVPGCYKTMGMAVMLDEIITYVQSLQTQVEFLSTRLATAGAFDPTTNPFETLQIANTFQGLNFENVGLDFGYCSQLPPHNT